MKTILRSSFAMLLAFGTVMVSNGQKHLEKYQVTTQIREAAGSYQERKVYRGFLEEYMKNCPYISKFSIEEQPHSTDNHEVIWKYDVNSWNDITRFYSWIGDQLKLEDESGLKKALEPYAPKYQIGGQIIMEKKLRSVVAKK